jgi:hypothetical protein
LVRNYFNARWYDADTARFVSEDPARDGGAWYVYVGHNPLRYFDPTGLRRVDGESADSDEDEVQRNSEFEEKKRRVRVRNEVDIDLEELTEKAAQRDNPDLTPQERAELEAEINELQKDVVRNINDLIASGYEIERLYDSMGSYNRTVIYNSESWFPGSTKTQPYLNELSDYYWESEDVYISYIHPGDDRLENGQYLATPLFVQVLGIDGDELHLGIIGLDRSVELKHIASELLSQFSNGQILSPGKIGEAMLSDDHLHVTQGGFNHRGQWGFIDPNSHNNWRPETDFWVEKYVLDPTLNEITNQVEYSKRVIESFNAWGAPMRPRN